VQDPINPLQRHEWMLRIPLCNMQTGLELLRRVPDPQPGEESSLLDAMEAMETAIYNIRQWCEANNIKLRESMLT
jgi:hypothetical protein